ncbi:flagellar hook protein FlgE [Marinospirillum insulare]|uniref:Flagellar hook protein FlgE n=1 Tax=Marinospirillum insulare TaxID=217169 RepID=A0ABQ5ZZK2_9GAMM|nr:flagellar hook protein FlgE [Marinospirillum insulare]GLR63314.1 flagellar hook protein FlgE [Marinospirillum insulare]
MSFNTGLSGLRAAQMDLSVTGNNIANASTKGFKQSRAEFGDVYSASILGTGRNSVGSGVLVERVSQQHTQGNIDYTDRALDMAIEGNGYFVLSNNGQIEYTRAGYFDLDKEGYITNNTGKRLQGYSADLQGNIGGVMGDIQLTQTNVEPNATSRIDVELNLDSRKENLDFTLFDPRDRTTYSDANQTPMYDSLGIEHVVTQYFVKVAPVTPADGNTWAVVNSFNGKFYGEAGQALYSNVPDPDNPGDFLPLTAETWDLGDPVHADAGGVTVLNATLGGYLATPSPGGMAQATLAFNPQGSLRGYNDGFDNTNTEPFAGSLEDNFDIEVPEEYLEGAWVGATSGANNEINYNLRGTTQYGASYSAQSQFQDGYTTGRLAGIEVSPDGTIFGRYTNGQNRPVGQVPLVTFRNPEGLKPNGSTAWLETSESGIPTTNKAGTGITGTIAGGALEESNVDLAEELVKMIIGQRNYQANAKTIQTQDTITQTIINLR